MKPKYVAIAAVLILLVFALTLLAVRTTAVNVDFPTMEAVSQQTRSLLGNAPHAWEAQTCRMVDICAEGDAVFPKLAEESFRRHDQILTVVISQNVAYGSAIVALTRKGIFTCKKTVRSPDFTLRYVTDTAMTPDQARMKKGLMLLYGEGQSFFPDYPGDLSRCGWDTTMALFSVFAQGKFHTFIVDCISSEFSTPPEIGVYFGAFEAACRIFSKDTAIRSGG